MKSTRRVVAVGIAALAAAGAITATGAGAAGSHVITVNVGVDLPLSGSLASLGQEAQDGIRQGAIVADNTILKSQTVKVKVKGKTVTRTLPGYQLSLAFDDDTFNSATAAANFQQFVSASKVAIIGPLGSLVSGGADPIANAAHIPTISMSAPDNGLTAIGPYIFTSLPALANTVPAGLLQGFTSKKIAVNKMAVFVQNGYVAGQDEATGLDKLLAAKPYKTKPILTGQFNSTDTDFSAEVTLVQSNKPTVIFLSGSLPAVGLFASQLRSAGVTAIICGDVSTALPSFEQQVGASTSQGVIGTTFWYYGNPAQTSASSTFSSTYLATYGSDPSEYSAIGYDSTLALAHAIRQAGSIEPAKIQAALANLKPFQGALGPSISFSGASAVIPRTLTGAAYAVQWSGGQLVPYGSPPTAKPKPKTTTK